MINQGLAVEQLTGELLDRVQLLGDVVGHDLTEQLVDLTINQANCLVDELTSGRDPQGAADRLLAALWPETGEPPLRWWRTPLGVALASAMDLADAPGWSQAEAAEVLGVTRGTVAQLMARKDLSREPGRRSVSRWSVLARVSRQWDRRGGREAGPSLCGHMGDLPNGTAVMSCTLTVLGWPQEWPPEDEVQADLGAAGALEDTIHLCEQHPARRIYRALGREPQSD
ncbi:hypothetical protein AB0C02_28215 [Micromonospora sp. NPDC048999]|uniref:hypothetical protein n=1 Tax=Micromonospora sp. NPDC048999 TaxID=3155391 RepID=UPI0033EFC556